MSEFSFKRIIDKVFKSAQVMFTLAYLFAIAMGMLFNYFKYEKFSINIFDYATITDFLLAPFADYRILLYTAISIVVLYVFTVVDNVWKTKFSDSYSKATWNLAKHRWYSYVGGLSILSVFVWLMVIFAQKYGEMTYSATLRQAETKVIYMNGDALNGKLIGKTSDMMFLYVGGVVKAIPLSGNIMAIDL